MTPAIDRSIPAKRKSSRQRREEAWHRRQALQVAAQLPDQADAALAVLRHAETLVRTFLGKGASGAAS